MSATIYRTEDPTLKTVRFGAVYQIHAPRRVSDGSGVSSIEPLDVPDGWDDSYEYAMDDANIWSRLACLAMDAYLADAILEVSFVPVNDEEADVASRALLYRFTRLY